MLQYLFFVCSVYEKGSGVKQLPDSTVPFFVPLHLNVYDFVVIASGGMNKVFGKITYVKPETTYQNSRFDFYIECGERKIFIEVKGVTLEENGVALFPDAPTERGIKHIRELEKCVKEGNEAYILFVIQMKGMTEFRPNEQTHKEFADALRHAAKAGVKIIARDCIVTPDSMEITGFLPVWLD